MEEHDKELAELKREVSEMKKDLSELKGNASELKKLVVYMNKKINSIEPLPETKTSEIKEANGKTEKKEEPRFKCDKCDYRAKRKATLEKHKNTKH